MPSIDKFCNWMETACDVWDLGYDQWNRWDVRDGGECDCSSLVITALMECGFGVGDAMTTHNMRYNLLANGWKCVPVDGKPQRGDILLSDQHHVAVCLRDNWIAQASIGNNGLVYGDDSGDQTGWETNTRTYYDYPWDVYMRYMGEQETDMPEIYWCDGVAFFVTDDKFVGIPDLNALDVIKADYKERHGGDISQRDIDANWRDVLQKTRG